MRINLLRIVSIMERRIYTSRVFNKPRSILKKMCKFLPVVFLLAILNELGKRHLEILHFKRLNLHKICFMCLILQMKELNSIILLIIDKIFIYLSKNYYTILSG